MKKSVLTREYAVLLKTWRDARRKAGVTQVDLAKELGKTQSFVSKCERGAARLDVVQLRRFFRAIGATLPKLIKEFERRLFDSKRR